MIHATEAGQTSPVRILVDYREEACGLPGALRARWTPVDQTLLDVGDVAVGPRVLIERKCLTDFVASVADGRLFDQAYRLGGAAVRPALLLEGAGELRSLGLTSAHIRGLKLTLAFSYRLPVLRTLDLESSADLIVAIALRESRWWRRRQAWNARNQLRPALDALMAIPGVGSLRARRLLQHFGSVAAVATASNTAIRKVAGIGPSTAEAIRRALQVEIATPNAPSQAEAPSSSLPPSAPAASADPP